MADTPQLSALLPDQRIGGQLAETTRNSYAWVLRGYPGSLNPPDLNQVKDFVASLHERGLAPATVITRIRALKRYSAWWAEDNDEHDPLLKLKYPKQTEPLPGRIAEDAVIDQALDALARWREHRNNVRDHALVSLLKYTGMRRSEIARMRVEHVDLEARLIESPYAKGNRSRTVPMHPTLVRSMRRWIRHRERSLHADKPWLRWRVRPEHLGERLRSNTSRRPTKHRSPFTPRDRVDLDSGVQGLTVGPGSARPSPVHGEGLDHSSRARRTGLSPASVSSYVID